MPTIEIRAWNHETDELEPRTVDAIAISTPALAVNRAVFRQPGYTRWWTVTHAPSGLHLPVYLPTPEQVVAFADDLNGLTDWSRPHEELKNLMSRDNDARHALLPAKARHGGLFNYDLEPDYRPDTA